MAKSSNAKSVATNSTESLEFCLRLTRAYAVLTRRLGNVLSSLHGLSFGDFMILYYLDRAPESKLRRIDLAERLGVTASGVTRSLLPLEKLGLVSRQLDPRDARVGYATLTGSGEQLLKYALVSIEPIANEAIQTVPTEQLGEFSLVLGQVAGINLSNN